jgi:hypothetical protein
VEALAKAVMNLPVPQMEGFFLLPTRLLASREGFSSMEQRHRYWLISLNVLLQVAHGDWIDVLFR